MEVNITSGKRSGGRKGLQISTNTLSVTSKFCYCAPEIYSLIKEYVNIHTLLKILTILPVLTAVMKRSFSSLRKIKSYQLNTFSEAILNGLALLSIHPDIHISDKEVLDKYSKEARKMNFVL